MEKTYRIADCNIRIQSIWDLVHRMCRDYEVSEKPDVFIQIKQSDIDAERDEETIAAELEHRQVRNRSDAYMETRAVHRKIAEKILDYDTLLFHGSAVAVDGYGYLFTAPSGTGKSTHARLWMEMLGDRAVMVNDDKPFLRVTESGVIIYGTPWNGKYGIGNNISAPLRAICVLEQAKENRITVLSGKEAVTSLMLQAYIPAEPVALQKTLKLLDRMARTVRFYHLQCNMDPEAAVLSWQTMRPDKEEGGE